MPSAFFYVLVTRFSYIVIRGVRDPRMNYNNIIILSLPIIYFLVALYSKLDSAINCIVNTQKFLDVILIENLRDLSAFCPY